MGIDLVECSNRPRAIPVLVWRQQCSVDDFFLIFKLRISPTPARRDDGAARAQPGAARRRRDSLSSLDRGTPLNRRSTRHTFYQTRKIAARRIMLCTVIQT